MSILFFFFKQKTAYEMRISDWSSDVCSSDLSLQTHFSLHSIRSKDLSPISKRSSSCVLRLNTTLTALFTRWRRSPIKKTSETYRELRVGQSHISFPPNEERSEEHTSELQSLMRISYAVFCLKKKQNKTPSTYRTPT